MQNDKKEKKAKKDKKDKRDKGDAALESKIADKTAEEAGKQDAARQQSLEYLKRVEVMLDSHELDGQPEERNLFIRNVLGELEADEFRVSCDMLCSRVLEKLFEVASPSHVHRFASGLGDSFLALAKHRYGSHVFQAILGKVGASLKASHQINEDDEDEGPKKDGAGPVTKNLPELFLHICEVLLSDIASTVSDTYGGHVIAATILTLAGLPTSKQSRSKASQNYRESTRPEQAKKQSSFSNAFSSGSSSALITPAFDVPQTFNKMLLRFADAIVDLKLVELSTQSVTAVVIENLLTALKLRENKKCLSVCIGLVGDIEHVSKDKATPFSNLIVNGNGSHVVDKLLNCASPTFLHSLYIAFFRSRLGEYSLHPIANFVVTSLLTKASTVELFDMMASELVPIVEDILAENRFNVIKSLIETSARLVVQQKEIVKAVLEAFHMTKPEDYKHSARLILGMITLDKQLQSSSSSTTTTETLSSTDTATKDNTHSSSSKATATTTAATTTTTTAPPTIVCTLQGSLLAQAILAMKPGESKPLVDSIMALSVSDLVFLALHPSGSHVLEHLVHRELGLKKILKILRLFKGQYYKLAIHSFGSRVLEKFWSQADIVTKEWIAEELLEHEYELMNVKFGIIIARNCKLDFFKRKRADWVATLESGDRKRKMFADIIDDEEPPQPAKQEPQQVPKRWKDESVDSEMAALGFTLKDARADLDEVPELDVDGEHDEEIDAIFRKKPSSKKGHKTVPIIEASTESPIPDTEEIPVEDKKQQKRKQYKDMDAIVTAITDSKSNKKKKNAKEVKAPVHKESQKTQKSPKKFSMM